MTKVSPTSDLSAFLATLRRSGLLSEEEFAGVSESLGSAGDAKAAARELLKQNKITRWQAGQLLHGYHQLVYGKYKLLDQLGSGEMGRVYLAEHGQLGRRVALKALSRKHTADPRILKLFLSDARRVGGLDHPNLCHMYDVNQEAERYFLVMEYVEGQNLQQFVEKGGKPSLAKVIEIVRQTAQGLGHAHAQKVLHGDLKPTNIIVDKNGVVKILDIGLSRLTEATAVGTIEDTGEAPSLASGIYRPQEQISGKSVEPPTDWYSLGAVLCFLLTGKPFQSPDACRSIDELKAEQPEAPVELLTLCTNLLAENPADRPASQDEVIAALDAASKAASTKPAVKPPVAVRPALQRAKAEPAAAVAKADSSAGKPRKPPVARPLNDAPVNDTPPTSTEVTVDDSTSSDTFAFALNTTSTPAAKKPPVKRATAAPAVVTDSSTLNLGTEKTPGSNVSASKSAAKNTKWKVPLIVGGAIGGGVLVLLLAVGLVYVLMSGGDEATVADASKNAAAASKADSAVEDTSGDSEANPEEANPGEANPAVVAPAADAAPTENVATAAANVTDPAPGLENPAPVAAPPAETATADAAPTSADDSASAATAETPAPIPAEPAAAKEPSLAQAIAASPEAATPPAEAPAPAAPQPAAPKAAPGSNPFAGFAKAVSLPKLPTGMSEPTPETLAPVTLGPCKVDGSALIIVRLLGGETAFKGGRQKFMLDAANNGTAERDWEVRVGTESESDVIALVSAKDQNISFQWTPEGAKNAASPYLANCLMEFSAGSGNHQCALRETVTVEPLVVDLEKPNAGVKWNLDALPDDRQMEIEVASVQSGAPKSRVESNLLTSEKPSTNVLMGPSDDKLPFAIELKMSASAKQVEIKAVPKLKLEGLPPGKDRYNKKGLQNLVMQTAAALQGAEQRHMVANQIKNGDQKKKALEQAEIFKAEVAKANDTVQAINATVQAAQSTTIHFRVWYLADTGKVLLLDTGGPPPPGQK